MKIDNINAQQLYDKGQGDYDLMHFFFRSSDNLGMHYGLWDKNTKTIWQAQQNENEYVRQKLKLSSQDTILDAGCGIGGSAIPLALKYKLRIIGISIANNQVLRANEMVFRLKIQKLVSFEHQDYHHTHFLSSQFNKIYSVESAGYSNPALRYFKEMNRILSPGGQLLILDGYLTKPISELSKKVKDRLNLFCNAWCIPNPQTLPELLKQAKKAGFTVLKTEDLLNKILPSAPKFALLAQLCRPIYEIGFSLGWLPIERYNNMIAGIMQNYFFENRIFRYYSIHLRKN